MVKKIKGIVQEKEFECTVAGINNQVEFDNREVEKTEREREIRGLLAVRI